MEVDILNITKSNIIYVLLIIDSALIQGLLKLKDSTDWSHIDFMIATCHHHHHPYNFLEIRVIPLCEVDDKHRGKFLYNSKNV